MFLPLFSCFRRIKPTYQKERISPGNKVTYHKIQNIYYNTKMYTAYKITNIIPKGLDTWYYMVDPLSEITDMHINFNMAYKHYGYLSITNTGAGVILSNFHQRLKYINHEDFMNKASLFYYYRHSLEDIINFVTDNLGTFGYEYIPYYKEPPKKVNSIFIYREYFSGEKYRQIDKKLSENPFNLFLKKNKNKLKKMGNDIIKIILPVIEIINEDIKRHIKQDITIKYLKETYNFKMGDYSLYEISIGLNFYMSFLHRDSMIIFRVFVARINRIYDIYLILYIIVKDNSIKYKLIIRTISITIGEDLPDELKHIENRTIIDYTEIPRDNSDFSKIISDMLNNQKKFSLV